MTSPSPSDRFHCDRLRVTLSVEACAKRWSRVADPDDGLRCARCSGCPIGARNAGVAVEPVLAQAGNLSGSAPLCSEAPEPARAAQLSGAPLGVLPDSVIAAVIGIGRRQVARARVRAGLNPHGAYWQKMRAAVETSALRTARDMAQEARDAALWVDEALALPRPSSLDPRALWAVFSAARDAAARAAGVRVAPLALPAFEFQEPDRVEWSDHPVGLLPDALVAQVVERSRRQVTRVAGVAWHNVQARVWRAAGLQRAHDVAWLSDGVRRLRAWAREWCPESPAPTAPQLALGLPCPAILDQTPPDDPVALAHYYNALVAHCRRALREEK